MQIRLRTIGKFNGLKDINKKQKHVKKGVDTVRTLHLTTLFTNTKNTFNINCMCVCSFMWVKLRRFSMIITMLFY